MGNGEYGERKIWGTDNMGNGQFEEPGILDYEEGGIRRLRYMGKSAISPFGICSTYLEKVSDMSPNEGGIEKISYVVSLQRRFLRVIYLRFRCNQ